MGSLIGYLATTFIGEKWARPAAYLILAVGIFAALGMAKCTYDRAVIQKHEQKAKLEQTKRERKADANLNVTQDRQEAASQQRQKELDNATHDIPDRGTSPRQRATACVELRRQAKQRRQPEPAC